MAFDGGFLHKLVRELNTACDCHIDKIYQPSKDELVFLLRKKGFVKRLFITVKSGAARIHFTENKFENPVTPPNFCMLLRKHLSSAKLINVCQPDLERVAELIFLSTSEMGDPVELRLICELIGNQANVILVKDGRILDALRHSDVETAQRLILPGAKYEYPLSQQKLNPLTADPQELLCRITNTSGELSKTLLYIVDGFSPLICREIEFLSSTLGLESAFKKVILDLAYENTAVAVLKPDNSPLDFSYTEINQYGKEYKNIFFNSYSNLLDFFFTAKENTARIQSAAHDIIRLINNLKSRTEKKLSLRLTELKKCENRDDLRIYGELIKANLHIIPNGSTFAEVPNYYDQNLATIRIPLNPALSPAKNAEKYFKDYKKTYTAEQTLTVLTENDRNELVYLDSVADSISRCKTVGEIAEIRAELVDAGYIKKTQFSRKQKNTPVSFNEETSAEGYRIVIGKNNMQNDYITTRLADKNDMWFHVKNIPGSHVVVLCKGNPLSDATILKASTLAAQNSKASESSQVPVDYTAVKNVKKPSGAKPGMVIYTTNKTVYVNPKEAL